VSERITEAELLTLEHGIDHDPVWLERLSHELRRARVAEVARLVENVAQRVGYLKRAEQAEAEVERLTRDMTQLEKWSEGLVIETQRLQGIEAEVARLRAERDKWEADALQKLNDYKCAMIDKAAVEAEVERLLAEMKHNDPASYSSMVQWREKCYEARAEVARLRAALETAREYVPRQAVVTLELCDAALRGDAAERKRRFDLLVSKLEAKVPERGEGEK
jgi:hypothetical protein